MFSNSLEGSFALQFSRWRMEAMERRARRMDMGTMGTWDLKAAVFKGLVMPTPVNYHSHGTSTTFACIYQV